VQTAISFGATLLGAMFGRKSVSAGTVGKATTAARGVGRSMKEAADVTRAQETVATLQAGLQELETSLQADIAAIEATHDAAAEPLARLVLRPKRSGIQVKLVALTWVGQGS
jgi:hypothetical protein